jgi:hypothetical protein
MIHSNGELLSGLDIVIFLKSSVIDNKSYLLLIINHQQYLSQGQSAIKMRNEVVTRNLRPARKSFCLDQKHGPLPI